jgi:tRNA (guanine-N7-)-methyltransferase
MRHLESSFLRPVAPHSERAYSALAEQLAGEPRPLILDSFCGTGMSTAQLAQQHPAHLVVGVDQSAHRLAKHERRPGNYLLLRANCEDIWQLLLRNGQRLDHHYLLYPNPWPKGKHLQRRVHGHASFPWLLQLGGSLELRSNWQLYVEEFGLAMHIAGRRGTVSRVTGAPALTLFEDKYQRSGQALWRYFSAPVW